MKVMSINAGSSTLKFSLFNMEDESVIASGNFERIGMEGSFYTIKYHGEKVEQDAVLENHSDAIKILLERLLSLSIITSLSEIKAVGHRIVNGGSIYQESVLITEKVIEDLILLKDYAPLHNPAHVLGIRACQEALPDVPMVAVFDTAFHQTMDPVSYLYPVPYAWYQDYGVRKYGAHGTSHRYIAKTISDVLGKKDLKIISCHLGSGASICAIKDGKCVDTSMGFTPLAGVMMGTRSGDIDPSLIPYVMEKEGKNAGEIIDDLNHRSGLLGMSQKSNDMRDIVAGIQEGNENCLLAAQKFDRTVVNYIASYYVLLGGCDVLCFTAGIGENSLETRMRIVELLRPLGFELDVDANNCRGELKKISKKGKKPLIYVVPTNEELMIARDTKRLVR